MVQSTLHESNDIEGLPQHIASHFGSDSPELDFDPFEFRTGLRPTPLRARKQLTREQTRNIQRIQKTLEEANIKLDSVFSDILGLSGRRMIEAMIAGVSPERQKINELYQ